jgi:hypothetical protein
MDVYDRWPNKSNDGPPFTSSRARPRDGQDFLEVGGRVEHYHYALLPLDVAFMQRDRLLPAVKYDAHSFAAVGYAHNDAGVNFHPRAAGLAQGRKLYPHAGS